MNSSISKHVWLQLKNCRCLNTILVAIFFVSAKQLLHVCVSSGFGTSHSSSGRFWISRNFSASQSGKTFFVAAAGAAPLGGLGGAPSGTGGFFASSPSNSSSRSEVFGEYFTSISLSGDCEPSNLGDRRSSSLLSSSPDEYCGGPRLSTAAGASFGAAAMAAAVAFSGICALRPFGGSGFFSFGEDILEKNLRLRGKTCTHNVSFLRLCSSSNKDHFYTVCPFNIVVDRISSKYSGF